MEKCLRSLRFSSLVLEVIVVDNASADDSVVMVKTTFPEVMIIANHENVGFAKANNQGLAVATGRHLLLLNPDTEVLPGALEKSLRFMEEHSEVGVLGCRLLNTDRTLQPSVRAFPTLVTQALILLKLHHLLALKNYLALDFDYEKTQSVDQVMGAFFMIRREVYETLGGLDERFYIWFEEVDYCKSVKEVGFQVWYLAEARVVHHGGQSFNQMMSLKKQRIFNRSLLYYFRKHHQSTSWLVLWCLQPVSLFLAWLAGFRRRA